MKRPLGDLAHPLERGAQLVLLHEEQHHVDGGGEGDVERVDQHGYTP